MLPFRNVASWPRDGWWGKSTALRPLRSLRIAPEQLRGLRRWWFVCPVVAVKGYAAREGWQNSTLTQDGSYLAVADVSVSWLTEVRRASQPTEATFDADLRTSALK